jgi:hypothetical protein
MSKELFKIVHCASSEKNPLRLSEMRESVYHYSQFNPYYKQIQPTNFSMIGNKQVYDFLKATKETIPLRFLEFVANLPVFGSFEKRKQV